MNKSKTLVIVLSSLLLCCLSFLASYFFLKGIGVVAGSEINLEVNISDTTHTYNGQERYLNTQSFEIVNGKLEQGHKLSISSRDSLINVGQINCMVNVAVFDENGYDVSKRYNIRYNSPLIIVKPLPVTFQISSGSQSVYSGQSISYDQIVLVDGELIEGHEYKPYVEGTVTNVWDKQESNKIISHVYDQAGNDVTKNYSITVEVGDLRVYPREITIKPIDSTFEFDGKYKTATGAEVSSESANSLIAGHYIECEYSSEFYQVGSYSIFIKNYVIKNSEGQDVTKNYQVKTVEGKIEITKKTLKVIAPSESYDYDGELHTCNSLDKVTSEGLVIGHKITNVKFSDNSKIRDIGSVSNVIMNVTIYDSEDVDVTNCYQIEYVNGVLEVGKTKLYVEAASDSFEYNGETHSVNVEKKPTSIGLIEGDFLEYEYSGSQTTVGISTNTIKNIKVFREENGTKKDVTHYYDIYVTDGVISVNKKELELTYKEEIPAAVGKVKDSEEFECSSNKYKEVSYTLDAGEYYIGSTNRGFYLCGAIIKDEDSSNNEISFNASNLSLLPKNDSITSLPLIENVLEAQTFGSNNGLAVVENRADIGITSYTKAVAISGRISVDQKTESVINGLKLTLLDKATIILYVKCSEASLTSKIQLYEVKATTQNNVSEVTFPYGSNDIFPNVVLVSSEELTIIPVSYIVYNYNDEEFFRVTKVMIMDKDGIDITENYNINYELLTLPVNRNSVDLYITISGTYNYDDEVALIDIISSIIGLVNGDSISTDFYGENEKPKTVKISTVEKVKEYIANAISASGYNIIIIGTITIN